MSRLPPWLEGAPTAAAAYLGWRNRPARAGGVRLVALALIATGVAGLGWAEPHDAAQLLMRLQRHLVLLGIATGMASVYSAARRREALAARAAHSWLAALPLAAGMRRLEAATLQLAPLALLLIAAGAAYLLVRWRFAGGGIGPAALDAVGRSLLSGALAGAAVGGAWPLPKPQFPPPGSRYVPPRAASARRGFRGAEWLGHWPVRRSFAFAQPKTLSRTVLPLLILMPMGTSAAAALLAVALLGGMTAAVFVVASLLSVTGEAGRWLQPLPIAAGRLARLLWPRSLAVLGGIGALTGWLAWVGTLALPRAILLGVALPAAAGAVAVVGGVIALRRAERR